MKCIKCKRKLVTRNVTLKVELPENYGIMRYNDLQMELHKDIQKLITTKYIDLGADDCMIVFSRIYSVYALSHLKDCNLIEIASKNEKETK